MVEIDASAHRLRELNQKLRAEADRLCAEGRAEEETIVLRHPDARHNLGVGLVRPVRVEIDGSGGYFCMGLCDQPTVRVRGNVGWGFADNLLAGSMVVDGNAGAVCGVAMQGGSILVRGNTGSRMGQVMKGGSIVCCGNAGYRAGSMMMGGVVVVFGDAAEALGEFMMDGEIFVAGRADDLGEDAVRAEQREGDAERLAALLDGVGVEPPVPPAQFTKIISDQRALRYQEYESGELLFGETRDQKTEAVTSDGNRDVMTFDSD